MSSATCPFVSYVVATCVVVLLSLGTGVSLAQDAPAETPGSTTIAKWKDGRRAPFILEFDDSTPTHLNTVIPMLNERKMVGTFYINPGNGLFKARATDWAAAVKSPYVVIANHTWTHKAVATPEQLDEELRLCNEAIAKLYPDRPTKRLISWGQPGGVKWDVTKEQLAAALAKYHLVKRPPFWGPPFHQKSKEEVLKLVDTALKKGEMGHCDFHGVGGDWHVTPVDWFTALLDKLDAHRDELWITDPVSWHQYVAERKNTTPTIASTGDDRVAVLLTTTLDPTLYALPLTLQTRVPAAWGQVRVTQGKASTTATATDGIVQYDAMPGGEVVVLEPAGR